MGKGDKKSKKGKITLGSYGVSRPKKKASAPAAPKAQEKPKAAAKPKAAPKAAAKKKSKEEKEK